MMRSRPIPGTARRRPRPSAESASGAPDRPYTATARRKRIKRRGRAVLSPNSHIFLFVVALLACAGVLALLLRSTTSSSNHRRTLAAAKGKEGGNGKNPNRAVVGSTLRRLRLPRRADAAAAALASEESSDEERGSGWRRGTIDDPSYDPSNSCAIRRVHLEDWETEQLWNGNVPIVVSDVTHDLHWAAVDHWTRSGLLQRYADVPVELGHSASIVSERLRHEYVAHRNDATSTLGGYVTNMMHPDPERSATSSDEGEEEGDGVYVFDRRPNFPPNMMNDARPLPLPNRDGLDDWPSQSFTTFSIGTDGQGLTFHRHNAAWNVVVHGSKRWILWDADRAADVERLKWMTRGSDGKKVSSREWIESVYRSDGRDEEIRRHGYDCLQGEGDLVYVPEGWAHMVVNVGDVLAVVSERGVAVADTADVSR